jgi:hypothetical protein
VPRPGGGVDPVLVCILNLFLGGAGYLLLGQKRKGIIAIVVCAVFLFPPSCGTLSGVVAAFTAIDGYLQAQQLQEGKSIDQWTWFRNHR